MSSNNDFVYVGVVGLPIELPLVDEKGAPLDLTGKTVTYRFDPPRGATAAEDPPSFVRTAISDPAALAPYITTPALGDSVYVTTADDLNVAGTWHVQPFVAEPTSAAFPNGRLLPGEPVKLVVKSNRTAPP